MFLLNDSFPSLYDDSFAVELMKALLVPVLSLFLHLLMNLLMMIYLCYRQVFALYRWTLKQLGIFTLMCLLENNNI